MSDASDSSPSLLMPVNDWPYPIVCDDCDRPIPAGSPHSFKLDSIDPDGMEWSVVICATGYCRPNSGDTT